MSEVHSREKTSVCETLCLMTVQFQDVNTPAVLRQTAATYMASYIARSKFVSVE